MTLEISKHITPDVRQKVAVAANTEDERTVTSQQVRLIPGEPVTLTRPPAVIDKRITSAGLKTIIVTREQVRASQDRLAKKAQADLVRYRREKYRREHAKERDASR